MLTVHYERMLALIGRLDPQVIELAQQITDMDDVMAEIVHGLGATTAAQTAGRFGEDHIGPHMADVLVRAENVLYASRSAAQEWHRADLAMSAQVDREPQAGPSPTMQGAV